MPPQSGIPENRAVPGHTENGQTRLRLAPIEKPKGILLRIVYRLTRKRFGKVPTGVKVVAARVPSLMKISGGFHKFGKASRLDKELTHLVHMLVSSINGCGFCMDLGRWAAIKKNMRMDKVDALPQYKTSPLFTAREQAALAYAEEVTRTNTASDATFAALRKHLSDREIAELTVHIAVEHFNNLVQIPLGIGSDGLCLLAESRKR